VKIPDSVEDSLPANDVPVARERWGLHLKTLNEIPTLLSTREKKDRLNGVVFLPGEDTIFALKKAAALLPLEFSVYASAVAIETVESGLGNTCYELVRTEDPVRELLSCLSGERRGNGKRPDFVVRGDLLSLEDTHRAISLAGSERDTQRTDSAELTSDISPSPDISTSPAATERLFLSHVAVLDAAVQGRVLVLSDGFVHPTPDIKARLAIIRNGLRVCEAIGIGYPRVALLAAVEQVYQGMPVTVESAEIAEMSKAGEITRAYVDGPLSLDVALVEQVAREKGATGDVAGKADLLVGSSVEVISGLYMAQTVLARANAASVVVGGSVPLALPFPSDCIDNIFFSVCLACLLCSQDMPSTE